MDVLINEFGVWRTHSGDRRAQAADVAGRLRTRCGNAGYGELALVD